MLGRDRIVLVPPEIQKSFWVTSTQVSDEYLSEMTLFINAINFNITPSNARMQQAVLLRYIDSAYYNDIKTKLHETAEKFKKDNVSITFYPASVKVDTKKLIGQISGDIQYTIGDIQSPLKRVLYEWKFSYKQGQLRVVSFPEVKNHE
jgi:conjugal transfer pilus assembly protein TraE